MNKLIALLNKTFEDEVPSWVEDSLESIPEQWENLLFNQRARNVLVNIYNTLQDDLDDPDEDISPNPKNIFNFAKVTPLNRIHIVIMAQDPYPDRAQAHGLAFSSLNKKVPDSLKNIYKCLVTQKFIKRIPKKSDLTIWAKRGVLLLNSSLTTKVKKMGVHKKLWNKYTDLLVKNLCDHFAKKNRMLIFMLWGKHAESKSFIINSCSSDRSDSSDSNDDNNNDNSHIVLTWRHPSPMAQRCKESLQFINCTNFREANEILKDEYNSKNARVNIPKMRWGLKIKKVVAYTDGSAYPVADKPNAKNGYSCVFTEGYFEGMVLYGRSEQFIRHPLTNEKMCSTAQRAEGTAIWKTLIKCGEIPDGKWDEIEIITDSNHWKSMLLNFMPKWIEKDKDFENQKVPDITKGMWKEWTDLKKKGSVIIRHMNSHLKLEDVKEGTQEWCDIQNNDTADELANKARTELEYGQYIESTEYLD